MQRPGQLAALVLPVVAALLLALAPFAGPAYADPGRTEPGAVDTGRAPVMIVLDASGSMDLDDDGEPGTGQRMREAKQIAGRLIGALPADIQVGLAVYGTGTGNNTSEERTGCADVTILDPLAPIDREALEQSLEVIEPSGYAPIGVALQRAADELGTSGPRNIVLISDAQEYCATPEPCAAAQRLAAGGLAISTVGIDPDPAGEQLLACIATATGGVHLNADDDLDVDRERLTRVLTRGYQRAAQEYTPSGATVEGSPEISNTATVLTPGSYLDQTYTRGSYWSGSGDKNGTVRYYRIPQGNGMTPWVSATIVGDRRGTDGQLGLALTLVNADDDPCLPTADRTVSTGERDPVPRVGVVAGGVRPVDENWSEHCSSGGDLFLRVERLGAYRSGTALPVELLVRSEPGISGETGFARPEAAELQPPTPVEPTVLAGSPDYARAPRLVPGSTIADTIVAGETRYYRVPVDWGQRLAYRVVPIGNGTPVRARIPAASVSLRNVLRQPVALHSDNGQGLELRENLDDSDDPGGMTGDQAVAVAYPNRTSEEPGIAAAAVAGDYYLAIRLDHSDEAVRLTVPFTLTVAISGDAEPGPAYLPGVHSGETASVATSSEQAPTSAPESGADSSAAAEQAAATSSPEDLPAWIWALGGAAVALVLASLFALLSRRPRQRHLQRSPHPGD